MPDITYRQLQKAVADMTQTIARGNEAIQETARRMSNEAQDTARTAESIGAMNVDTATISETQQTAQNMYGLADATVAYASAADTTASRAQAVKDANRSSHDAINEAASRSPIGQAIYDLNSQFLSVE